jgi:hypothetical protein
MPKQKPVTVLADQTAARVRSEKPATPGFWKKNAFVLGTTAAAVLVAGAIVATALLAPFAFVPAVVGFLASAFSVLGVAAAPVAIASLAVLGAALTYGLAYTGRAIASLFKKSPEATPVKPTIAQTPVADAPSQSTDFSHLSASGKGFFSANARNIRQDQDAEPTPAARSAM